MNRFIALLIAFALGFWAQRTLTGPQPGIGRDALVLYVGAAACFLWATDPPTRFRPQGGPPPPAWRRSGLIVSLVGLGLAALSLVLLWGDLGSVPGLLLWPAATVLFVGGTFLEEKQASVADAPHEDERPANSAPGRSGRLRAWSAQHWDILVLALILLVALFARFYQLDVYPNGCQSDECNNGLDALNWLAGTRYAPYAETNEGQATFFTYLIALAFQLFGVGVTQMRAVSAVAGALTVFAFHFLARDLYGRKAALAAAALFATARWHVTFSRIVYELILQPLFMVLLAMFLLRGLRRGRRRDWALAGVALAAGMNSYTAFRVVPLIVAAFLAFWIVRALLVDRARLRADLEGMAVLAGAALPAILPLGVFIAQNWDIFTSRMSHISVFQEVEQAGSVAPIVDNLRKTLYMFNWQGDNAALNNLPGAPMLDTAVAVLFVLGVAYSLWYALQARAIPVFFLLWFVGVAAVAVLSVTLEAPSARRTVGMIPLIYLLAALVIDQLFLAWRRTWRGTGEGLLNGLVAVGVVAIMIANARAYFTVQAPEPAVWNAFSPSESAIGAFLTELPRETTVLVAPQYEHHSAVRFLAREHPFGGFDPSRDLPYRPGQDHRQGDLVYILEPTQRPVTALLAQIYPGGRLQEHRDRFGGELFLSYTVPQAELAATRGLTGTFYTSYPPVRAAEAEQKVYDLDVDMSEASLSEPAFGLWEGTLRVPEYGEYRFDLSAAGGARAVLQLGRQHRLELASADHQEGSEPLEGVLTATLASGFHPLRLEVVAGPQPGRVQLAWSGPGFDRRIVGGDALYPFDLGGQGLVGYYYPNADWQGSAALVRNDLLIAPHNPLPAPYSVVWQGKIAIPVSGTYTFGTRSDDGSFVFIDGQLVVDNGGAHGAQDREGAIYLEQGFHDLEVRYFELMGSRALELWWVPPGQGRALVDGKYLFPLEGNAIPEGLALPPPPEIARARGGPEPGTGGVVPGMMPDREAGSTPALRPSGPYSSLPVNVAWTFGGVCGDGAEQLAAPRGVAVDAATGDVFVADAGNGRVVRLDAAGAFVERWGETGEDTDQFQELADLVVEPKGTVLVLDALAQRLQRFTPEGDHLATFGADLTFYRPRGLGVDAGGQLAVADTGGVRIVLLDEQGLLLGEIGGRESDLAAGQPTDAALTPAGDLFFVEAETGAVTGITTASGVAKWSGPVPSSTIDGPHLAWRPAGGLVVSDPEGRRLLLFDAAGEPVGQFGAEAGLIKPVGVATGRADAAGELVVVADSVACRVVAFHVALPGE